LKVYLSKPDIVCAAGNNSEQVFERLLNNECFLSLNDEFTSKAFYLGKCKDLKALPKEIAPFYQTRTNQILYNAFLELESLIYELKKDFEKASFGIVVGTSTTGVEENYQAIKARKAYMSERNSLSNPAAFLNTLFDLNALNFGVSSACTSGAKALMQGARLIKSGLCDIVLVAGVDSLNTLTINGFKALDILSSSICKPFDKNRDGINIGEGAASFILISEKIYKSLENALKSEFKLELKAYKSNNDAFHITQPKAQNPDLSMLLKALLDEAELKVEQIDYISLHGTGTQSNDLMESALFSPLFKNTPSSSIKHLIGHTLAAAGSIEAALCAKLILKSLENSQTPLLAQQERIKDKALKPLNLVKKGDKARVLNALSSSFAFGGDNTLLILGAKDDERA